MKKLITNVTAFLLFTFIISSCGDESLRAENQKLKEENQKLVKQLEDINSLSISMDTTVQEEGAKLPQSPASKPYENLNLAKRACYGYQNLKSGAKINIPIAFLFESSQIKELTNNPYIRFYSSLRIDNGGQYTISAVGVDKDNKDVLDNNSAGQLNMYEFANPCPPCKTNEIVHEQNPTNVLLLDKNKNFLTFKMQ